MKKIKDFWILISALVFTTLVYFQSWLGPFKNWKQIADYPIYPTASNEWFISDALYFLNNSTFKINTSGVELYSFILTSYSFVNQAVINLLSKLTNNTNLAVNLFDLIGYYILIVVSFKILNALNINKIFAFVFSLLFTLTFYHQMQGLNPLMSWYFCVPIYCYFALKLFDFSDEKNELMNNKFIYSLLISAFILPIFGLVYALIGNIVILTAGFLSYFNLNQKNNKKKLSKIMVSYLVLASLSFIIVLQLNQSLLNYYQYPLQVEVEQNSFKLVQLFLPNIFHRNEELSALTDFYASFFPASERNIFTLMPINGSNMSVALGFISAIGLFFLLIISVASLIGQFNSTQFNPAGSVARSPYQSIVRKTFPLLLVLLLVGSFGGLGGLIALVFPVLGVEWFRASQFIHFLVLFALASLLQELINRYVKTKWNKWFSVVIASLFLIIGLFDQLPTHCGGCRSNEESLTKQTELLLNNKLFENTSASEWLQLPSTTSNMVSPSSFQYLFLQNSMQQHLLSTQQESKHFESEQVQARLAQLMPSFSPEDQVLIAQYLGKSGIVINKTNWCDWPIELPKLEQAFSLTQAVEVPSLSKPVFDSLQAYRLNKPLTSEQQQRLHHLLQSNAFQAINGKLHNQFDWGQVMDFSTYDYPPYVKNIDGLVGDKNIRRSQSINQNRCVRTTFDKNEKHNFDVVSWGDLFPNPFTKNQVQIDFYANLPKKAKIRLSIDFISIYNLTGLKPSEIPIELVLGQQKKSFKLAANSKDVVFNFELNNLDGLSQIQLVSSVPIIHLAAFQQSPGLDGLLVLKSIQIEPVKP